MKKVVPVFVMAVFAFSGFSYAQRDGLKPASPELDAKVEDMVDRAVAVKNIPLRLDNILIDLDYSQELFYASQGTKSDVTIKLVQLYNSLDDLGSNAASKQHIIEIIGMANNGPEAHKFFISVLDNGNDLYRKKALRIMFFHIVNGDDLYDEVKTLVSRKIISDYDSLGALKGADPSRAVSDIQTAIKKAEDLEKFVRMGNLLSQYKEPALMDVVVDRYNYFRDVKKEQNSALLYCFQQDTLKNYIAAKEGERLKTALDILSSRGVFDENDVPMLKSKLESKDLATREYAVDFLNQQMAVGFVAKDKLLKVFGDAYANETNQQLKLKLGKIIEKHETVAIPGGQK